MSRCCHHLIGDSIRFLFVDITRLVDPELALQTPSLFFAAFRALTTPHCVSAASAFALERAIWQRGKSGSNDSYFLEKGFHFTGSFDGLAGTGVLGGV